MISKNDRLQAKEFVFNLRNYASEYGFKSNENWNFKLVTSEEKKKVERDFHPTLAVKPAGCSLAEFFVIVKGLIVVNGEENEAVRYINVPGSIFLIAFNPDRRRE
jgi:hypothetical protein